ncbi:MAG: hypothetical protein JOZ15_16120 [Acidobacteria bacterium]|nr:hypothetical protein [Acidobacteriota bacterium]
MKKSFKGRLNLNRETLRLLEQAPLRKVAGGCVPVSQRTCGHPCTAQCSNGCTLTSCPTNAGPNCN